MQQQIIAVAIRSHKVGSGGLFRGAVVQVLADGSKLSARRRIARQHRQKPAQSFNRKPLKTASRDQDARPRGVSITHQAAHVERISNEGSAGNGAGATRNVLLDLSQVLL